MAGKKVEDTKEFRDAWNAGVSIVKLAKALGCCNRSVPRYAERFGYPPRIKKTQPVEAEPVERMDVRQIEIAGVGTYSGTDIRKNVSVRREPWLDEPEPISEDSLRKAWRASVLELLSDGFGVEDIAIRLHCDPVDVRYEVSRLRGEGVIAQLIGGSHA